MLEPNLVLARAQLDEVVVSCYLDSKILPDNRSLDEILLCIQKARLTFADLRHVLLCSDI